MSVTPEGLAILKQALCANGPRKHWGCRNSYFAATKASKDIQALLDSGHLIRGALYPNHSTHYLATPDGMRAAGLGPGAIERAVSLSTPKGSSDVVT